MSFLQGVSDQVVQNKILGYRLMVGHQVLVLSIEVRVLVPQLVKNTAFWLCFSLELG